MFKWIRHLRLGNQFAYETFFREQDRRPVGKIGVILSDLGMPESYKSDFYINFMNHVFKYSLPAFLHRFILADRGIALVVRKTCLKQNETTSPDKKIKSRPEIG